MEKESYNLLFFPGAHGRLRKVRLSSHVVSLILAFYVVGVITVAALANTYAKMLFKVSDYNSLRAERDALRIQNRALESAVSRTNARLDSLQSLAAEVALTYGFGTGQRTRFPSGVLAASAGRHSPLEPTHCTWLYAFNVLEASRFISPGGPAAESLFLGPLRDDSATPSIWPVRGSITAGFGQRLDPFTGEGAFHAGVDIAAPAGTLVRAAADGILFHAGPEAAYGNEILIDHGYGVATKYGHLARTLVVIGQEVKRGQVIGTVGMTGRTTGPHLHYEVLIHDTPVNPSKYLRG